MSRGTTTVREGLAAYLTVRSSYSSAATLASDRTALNALCNHLGADRKLYGITAQAVEQHMVILRSRVSPAVFNNRRNKIRSLCDYWTRQGWVKIDLVGSTRPARKAPPRRFMRLGASELLGLLDHANCDRDRALLALGINTGLRSAELTAVKIGDLDLAHDRMWVTVTKTGVAEWMPVTADLAREMRAWLTLYTTECGPLDPDWYLVPAKKPNRSLPGMDPRLPRLTPGQLKPRTRIARPHLIVTRALTASGLTGLSHEGFHTLRRSVARVYYDQATAKGHDAALRETAALLHHASSKTTEVYLGLTSEQAARDAVMAGKPFLTRLAENGNVVPLRAAK